MAEVMTGTLLAQAYEQGMEQGIENGIARGIERGETRAKRDMIFKVLRSRFGRVPESLGAHIGSLTTVGELDALFNRMLEVSTIEDLPE